jgi:hypothetical protein
MKYTRHWCATLTVILLLTPMAVAWSRTVTVMGQRSCEDWIKAHAPLREGEAPPPYILRGTQEAWLVGYISGVSSAYGGDKDVLSRVDFQVIKDWTDRYCSSHEKDSIGAAADSLFLELLK